MSVSRPPARLRNLALTALVISLVLSFGLWRVPASAQQIAVIAQQAPIPVPVNPGQIATVNMRLTNNSSIDTTFDITISGLPSGWATTDPGTINVAVGAFQDFSFQISVPANQVGGTISNIRVEADSNNTTASTFISVTVIGPTPTISPTPSTTPTPTVTIGPSATSTPTPQPCPETTNDPGNDQASAKLILVDIEEAHGICTLGDEDWFSFGGVGGKVYTVDITFMDIGLDLSLHLYDSEGNLLANNDDYFNRTPTPPNAFDIKPRIQSWTAPRDGLYYIRVRDIAGLGGNNRTYRIIVRSESYGPTPITVPEICRDLFEEDGLPEEAVLITSNETQFNKAICPIGDADWVKFFGKTGKIYYMYTDTRRFTNQTEPDPTEAGADTVIYLADRDGVSVIDFNDDIAGGGSLDSEIRFVPQADGFYYLQIKNVGDIGNQFIRYDFTLKLCVPGAECGRGPAPQGPTGPVSPGTGGTPTSTTTATSSPTPPFLDETEVAETEESLTEIALLTEEAGFDSFSGNAGNASAMVNGPLQGFADPSFEQVWKRNDQPVAAQRASRTWVWGPRGLMARSEGYLQAGSGLRQVQYFDKARMEVNNPGGDRNSRWFVTTGLLVIELITGKMQVGDNEFVQHAPADIPIAGDPDDPNAPTYASFGGVSGQFPGDRTGQPVKETINRAGEVGAYTGPDRPETRLARFVPESDHNVPRVFWDYLNAQGITYEGERYREGTLVDWVFTLGYPTSEAFWTRVRVGGVERDVLVQVFQRRVLTYSPDNPRGWQVEMGNVGRHYYLWRYGEELPSQ